ncbi:prephenate dehydrogenase [Varibaculum massiliense]|uniref:prephenate dehydrogenase n=1 Tax=Varibaculum massiliense TaxID=1852372 RepID=UPI0008DA6FC4|nr:prephenate dehydrogenase [Varibaculum massiliense]
MENTKAAADKTQVGTTGPVLIIGAGLLGASLGMRLSKLGLPVFLRDIYPVVSALACDMGAGQRWEEDCPDPALVIVATPPDVAADQVIAALKEFPTALVTDVASVKSVILEEVAQAGADPTRYVGSHPMAGRERSGTAFAREDLFESRPWVIVPNQETDPGAVLAMRTLALDVGSLPLQLDAETHDQSVALVSHVPQLVSSLLAAQLAKALPESLGLSGQGLRDTTRIASSDPALWAAIIAGNAEHVAKVLRGFADDMQQVLHALEHPGAAIPSPSLVGAVTLAMRQGNLGVARIPGKHGGAPRRYQEVMVKVPDEAGTLGRLFQAVGETGTNIEDLELEHSPGAAFGVARLAIEPNSAASLAEKLQVKGWEIVSA